MKSLASTSLFAAIGIFLLIDMVSAQRRVTPINSADELKIINDKELQEIKRQNEAKFMRTDSLTLDSLRRDSIEKAKNTVYRPTLMSATAGINFWDPLMRAFGQTYGGGDIWFAINLKNRFIPIVELGVGQANSTPDGGNFTYKNKLAFYGKIGMNYNFMATKDPKYQLYAGIRFAGTSFHYDITDITVDNGYWHDSPSHFEIVDQHSSAIWGEFVLGIQVEIVKNFSLGWAVRYNFPFSIKDTPNSRPWYIPGYGTRDNPLNISLSASYTLPFHKEEPRDANALSQPPEIHIQPQDSDSIVVPERPQRIVTPQPAELPDSL